TRIGELLTHHDIFNHRGVGRGRGDGCRLEGRLHAEISTLSMRQPSPESVLSLPILQRTTSWFCTMHPPGRLTTVVSINPAELPVHACRPARGLPQQLLIVPL